MVSADWGRPQRTFREEKGNKAALLRPFLPYHWRSSFCDSSWHPYSILQDMESIFSLENVHSECTHRKLPGGCEARGLGWVELGRLAACEAYTTVLLIYSYVTIPQISRFNTTTLHIVVHNVMGQEFTQVFAGQFWFMGSWLGDPVIFNWSGLEGSRDFRFQSHSRGWGGDGSKAELNSM